MRRARPGAPTARSVLRAPFQCGDRRAAAAVMSWQTGALAGSAPGLPFTSPCADLWRSPRLTLQGGHGEPGAVNGGSAEGDVCSVPSGTLRCCHCCALTPPNGFAPLTVPHRVAKVGQRQRGTPRTVPAPGLSQGQPGWKELSLCRGQRELCGLVQGFTAQRSHFPTWGNSCLRHPCSQWPNALLVTETV